jgi:hypothetical protein
MSLTLQPVRVETGTEDEEGFLVFADGRLVAVLVRLSDQHETAAGQWFYECGFGRFDGPDHPVFSDLDAARRWIDRRFGAVLQGRTPSQPRSRHERDPIAIA